MNWSDERYVKVYTRDTGDWVHLGWEAQALLMLLMRKVDRAGVFDLGTSGEDGLADLLRMPSTVLLPALTRLIADGCVTRSHDGSQLLLPNFMEAQESKHSDRQRQIESRSRRRASARHAQSLDTGHTVSQPGTPFLAVPSCTDLKDPEEALSSCPLDVPVAQDFSTGSTVPDTRDTPNASPPRPQSAPPGLLIKARAEAAAWIEWFNRTFGRQFTVRGENIRAVKWLLSDGHTQGAMRLVALHLRRQWAGDPKMERYLVPSTLLKRARFGEYLEVAKSEDRELASQFEALDAKPLGARVAAALEKTPNGPVAAELVESLRKVTTTTGGRL